MLNKRVKPLNNLTFSSGTCVIYLMSRDQRAADNHALITAQLKALEYKLPLIVVFNLNKNIKYRNLRHYEFMLSGLNQIEEALRLKNIPLIMTKDSQTDNLYHLLNHLRPLAVYFDFSPLRGLRKIQSKVAFDANYPVFVVDTHNIVPVWETSPKQEYSARTIRPKIHLLLNDYLIEPPTLITHPYTLEDSKIDPYINKPNSSSQNSFTSILAAGEIAAINHLKEFITQRLSNYAQSRNDPNRNAQSGLSPYLHFGQVSSLRVLLEIKRHLNTQSSLTDAFVEEIVVRKELADNYCYYNDNYDNFTGLPIWGQNTLTKHVPDQRDYIYSVDQFENGETHDQAWNAAQNEMRQSGKMHGYMRMYWAKKILEWTKHPQIAIEYAVYLNDTYELDGHDPNGYAGILWSIGGLHDRPWATRPIFGNIRYMSQSGLSKKFDLKKYIETWS